MIFQLLNQLAKVGLKEVARNKLANISKRVKRLETVGIETLDMAKFREIAREKPETRSQWLSQASKLSKLDVKVGLRFKSAAKQAEIDDKKTHNERVRSSGRDFAQLITMDKAQLAEVHALKLKSLRGKVSRVKKATESIDSKGNYDEGGTHATDKFDELLRTRKVNPDRNQLLSEVAKMNKIEGFQGITVKGAIEQIEYGASYFGDKYKTLSRLERNAIWDHVDAEMSKTKNGSPTVVAMVRSYLDSNSKVSVSFYNSGDKLKVKFGASGEEAKMKAQKAEATAAVARAFQEESVTSPLTF